MLFGWVDVTRRCKHVRTRIGATHRALIFRGASLLSKTFHAWASSASRRRRKLEAKKRYTLMLFRTSFYLWRTASHAGAKLRQRACLMRGQRLMRAVIDSWRDMVHLACVELPLKCILLLRMRMVWHHWRTLKRSTLVRLQITESGRWRVKRTAAVFAQWRKLFQRKLRIHAACDHLRRCKEKYMLRCSLFQWEGWQAERSAQKLLSTLVQRRQTPISINTINGPLMNSWEQHILAWRWRDAGAEFISSDEGSGNENEIEDNNIFVMKDGHTNTSDVRSCLNHLFSANTCVTSTPLKEKSWRLDPAPTKTVAERRESKNSFRTLRAQPQGSHDRGTIGIVARQVRSKAYGVPSDDAQMKIPRMRTTRNPILDRALVLGYCSYRVESHEPLMRCIKSIFRAFRKLVRKRRHCHKAFIYYRNNKHHTAISSTFHFWMSKVPELSHRSSSWLYPVNSIGSEASPV